VRPAGGRAGRDGQRRGERRHRDERGGLRRPGRLVEAAQAEGELNVIALPPDWANYGEIIDTFAAKYDIEVNSAQPDASSQDEINAANQLRGTDRAGRVRPRPGRGSRQHRPLRALQGLDLGRHPRRTSRTPTAWVNDYGGYMSDRLRPRRSPRSPRLDDLRGRVPGKVALNGDPTAAGAAFAA
jgi:putative spermidine/putrescine transport system substrate-binding protein